MVVGMIDADGVRNNGHVVNDESDLLFQNWTRHISCTGRCVGLRHGAGLRVVVQNASQEQGARHSVRGAECRQTVNAVRRPDSKHFTRGFLVVTPGLSEV